MDNFDQNFMDSKMDVKNENSPTRKNKNFNIKTLIFF